MPKKMKAYETFEQYFADQTAKQRPLIAALRKLVRRVAPDLEETVKWGNGCWVKGKVPVAYVHTEPTLVQFGFFRGAQLHDPQGLLRGKGQYVRHVPVRTAADIDARAFAALLREAAD
jgi:hypothetical protein